MTKEQEDKLIQRLKELLELSTEDEIEIIRINELSAGWKNKELNQRPDPEIYFDL